MANTREYLLYSDARDANPNGDMINDNRPRCDEETGYLEMSDARVKRYFREEASKKGFKVLVKPTIGKNGKQLDMKGVATLIINEELEKKKEALEQHLKDNYIDVKLFGIVGTTEPKFNVTGPLQVTWSKSVHEPEVKFAQGTSSFSSGDNKTQGTTWAKYFTPYALFRTYMVFNSKSAERQKINVEEKDLEVFRTCLIDGIRSYKSTSKNQMPRLLIEVVYKKHYIDGELDYVDTKYEKEDLALRSIEEFTFDLKLLNDYMERRKEEIEKVKIYMHPKVKMVNIPKYAEISIM